MARTPKAKATATDARRVRKQKNGNVVEETRRVRKLKARSKKRHDGEITRVRNGEEQVRLVTREPTATERHQAMGRAPRHGRTWKTDSEYKEAARKELKARTLECKGRNCGWPVDWSAAMRPRDRRQPPQSVSGDGCLGPRCGARKWKKGAAWRRRAMATRCEELESGERRLLEWPDGMDDTEAWARPQEVQDAMVARIRQQLGI
jgi:hypothetical protein